MSLHHVENLGVGCVLRTPAGIELSDVQLAEFRPKLGGIPQGQRYARITKSIEKGSDQLAFATLGCDRFLSDFLSDAELEEVRSFWAKARMPESLPSLSGIASVPSLQVTASPIR